LINISKVSDAEFFSEEAVVFASILKPVTPIFYDCSNATQSLITGAQKSTYGASDGVKGNNFATSSFLLPNDRAVTKSFQIGR